MQVRSIGWKFIVVIVIATVFLLGAVINFYLALSVTCDDCLPVITMANHVQHFILLVNILLLAGTLLLLKQRLLVAWLSPGVVGFALIFGPLWIPTPPPDVEGVELTAATYNVLGHAADPNATFEVIDRLDADFIALQELRPTLRHLVRSRLYDEYPYQFTRIVDYVDGLALLSKYPFVGEPQAQLLLRDKSVARYLRVVVDVEGQHVAIYVYHPPTPRFDFPEAYDDTYLQWQTEFMADMIEAEELPTLLLCDCNASPHSRQYGLLDHELDDAFQARGLGFGLTYPVRLPLIRIDYVWYSDEFVAVDAGVETGVTASDHFPMWARVVLEK
ncbi:MAG: endonuclease/exonuclease/phosphatase family protein [Chloroflexi bacterium]|nr:endonuclease/exonuclease/phosphatase family protein [Chloroflexota bacterium]